MDGSSPVRLSRGSISVTLPLGVDLGDTHKLSAALAGATSRTRAANRQPLLPHLDGRGGADTASMALTQRERVRLSTALDMLVDALGRYAGTEPDIGEYAGELVESGTDARATQLAGRLEELEVDQARIEERQAVLRAQSNKKPFRVSQRELAEVKIEMRQTSRAMHRSLREAPLVSRNLQKIATDRAALQLQLSKIARELRETGRFGYLQLVVGEERKTHAQVRQLQSRQNMAGDMVKAAQTSLAELRQERVSERKEAMKEIYALKEQLLVKREQVAVAHEYQLAEARAADGLKEREQTRKLVSLQERIWALRRQLALAEHSHAMTHDFLQHRMVDIQAQASQWVDRYEADTMAMDALIEEVNDTRASGFLEMGSVQDRIATCSKGMQQIWEELQKYNQYNTPLHQYSATRIQAAFRGYVVRRKIRDQVRKLRKRARRRPRPPGAKRELTRPVAPKLSASLRASRSAVPAIPTSALRRPRPPSGEATQSARGAAPAPGEKRVTLRLPPATART